MLLIHCNQALEKIPFWSISPWPTYPLRNDLQFALQDERLRTHANDDLCGLYFPLFYAAAAIPHIVGVTSLSDILVVNSICSLQDEQLIENTCQ